MDSYSDGALGTEVAGDKHQSAHNENAYSCNGRGIVRTSLISVLASLGLNTYLRGKSAEGWEGARRRIVPPRSFEILRSRLIDMKLKLGTHLGRQAI